MHSKHVFELAMGDHMSKIFQKDIVTVFALTFISLVCLLIPSLIKFTGITILYILLILFLPGYSLLTLLFPEDNRLIRRIIIGIPVSIIILFLFNLSLNYLKISSSQTLLFILTVITLFFASLGYIRRFNDSKKSENKYIICEKCGIHYKLKKGEFLDNFKVCQCGGELKYAKYQFMTKEFPDKDSKSTFKPEVEYVICEKCGGHYRLKDGETLEDFETCHCGGKLKYAEKDFKSPHIENKSKSGKYQHESRSNLYNIKKTVPAKNPKFMIIDIFLVWLITVLSVVFVLTPKLNDTILRSILSIILILFLPGYSLIAALFPKKGDLESIERFALSFGLSIVITPLIGLTLNYTQFGIRLEPFLISISIFTLLIGIIAFIRRIRIPDDEKFNIEFKNHYNRLIKSFKGESKGSKILSIVLLVSIILAISATTYVIVVPKEGETFTEFYILGANGKVSDYPTNLTAGQDGNVTIGIVNHEYADVNYNMIIKLNNQTIDNENITLSNNQSYEKPFKFAASNLGQNQELEFLLYKLPDNNNVYRSLHLRINTN
jgi:uncharacterized membrane protein